MFTSKKSEKDAPEIRNRAIQCRVTWEFECLRFHNGCSAEGLGPRESLVSVLSFAGFWAQAQQGLQLSTRDGRLLKLCVSDV